LLTTDYSYSLLAENFLPCEGRFQKNIALGFRY